MRGRVTFFYSPIGDSENVERFLGPDLWIGQGCDIELQSVRMTV
jgi:hypothetical protein